MLNFQPSVSSVHQLDLFLCEYLVGTIAGWLKEPGTPFRRWLREGLNQPELEAYFDNHEKRLLLNDPELQRVLTALESPPFEFDFDWIPWPSLHESYLLTLREIREVLGETAAEEFAKKMVPIVQKLDHPDLSLHHGAELVVDWIETVRGMKHAMGLEALLPQPEGSYPTPTLQRPSPENGENMKHALADPIPIASTVTKIARDDAETQATEARSVKPSSRRNAATKQTRECELLTQREVSELTGFAEPTLPSWRCSGIGGPPYIRVGKGTIRYRKSDLDQWCEDRLVRPIQKTG